MEVVFEVETEDGVEPGLEIESEAAGARRSRGVPDRSILRLLSMAAPKLSAAPFTNRGTKIANGPSSKINKWDGPAHPPTHGRKSASLFSVSARCTNASIQWIERKLFVKPASLKELLRISEFWNRGFAVVLVLKFLLGSARFVGWSTRRSKSIFSWHEDVESARQAGSTRFRTRFTHSCATILIAIYIVKQCKVPVVVKGKSSGKVAKSGFMLTWMSLFDQ